MPATATGRDTSQEAVLVRYAVQTDGATCTANTVATTGSQSA
jgi:hypothetical protein